MKAIAILYVFRSAIVMTLLLPVTAMANECGVNKIEVIVGGKIDIDKSENQQTLKCMIFTVNDSATTKTSQSPKIDNSSKQVKSISNVALKVNLYEKDRNADRKNILNSELSIATTQKTDLLKKKLKGEPVDDLQLSRIEADISALQRELSR
jgi:hypothetical protein